MFCILSNLIKNIFSQEDLVKHCFLFPLCVNKYIFTPHKYSKDGTFIKLVNVILPLEEVMFLTVLVCLRLCKNYWTDKHRLRWKDVVSQGRTHSFLVWMQIRRCIVDFFHYFEVGCFSIFSMIF